MDLVIEATIRVTVDDSFIHEWGEDEGGVHRIAHDELAWRLLRGSDDPENPAMVVLVTTDIQGAPPATETE